MNKQQAQEWLKGKGIDPQCMVQNSQGLQKFFNLSKLISEATEVTSLTTEEVRKAAIKVVSENLTGGEFQNDEYEAIKIIDALIEAGHITTQEQRREDKPKNKMKTAKQILKEQMRKECHTSQEVDEWYTEYSDTFSTVLKAMEAYAAQFTQEPKISAREYLIEMVKEFSNTCFKAHTEDFIPNCEAFADALLPLFQNSNEFNTKIVKGKDLKVGDKFWTVNEEEDNFEWKEVKEGDVDIIVNEEGGGDCDILVQTSPVPKEGEEKK